MTDPKYRVPTRYLWLATVAGVIAALVACGGGGTLAGVGSGGTGAAFSGPISGFGSIVVNGVRIDDSAATITLDDDNTPVTASSLKLGMMVDVVGEQSADGVSGKAATISGSSFVKGPISSVDLAGSRLTVLGTTVNAAATTVFDGSAVTGLESLAPGDIVEINGIPTASAAVVATRIERKSPASTDIRLTGNVQSVTPSDFVLNGITVQYQAADLVDFLTLEPGMLVRIKAALTGPSTAVASQIRKVRQAPAFSENQRVLLDGVVTRVNGDADFDVNGLAVSLANGQRPTGTIVLGARIQVTGKMTNNVLVANKVEVKDDTVQQTDAHQFFGPVANLDTAGKSFTLRDGTITVRWDNQTSFDNSLVNGGDSLANGIRIDVKGRLTGNILRASRIALER